MARKKAIETEAPIVEKKKIQLLDEKKNIKLRLLNQADH